jgi:hypothetical protein
MFSQLVSKSKFTRLFIFLLSGIFLILIGCNNEEDAKDPETVNSAAKITIADFQNLALTDISMTEMNSNIGKIDEFYDNEPAGTKDSADMCMDNLAMEHGVHFGKDVDDTYKALMNDIDFKECVPAEQGIVLNSAIGSLVMEKVKFMDASGNPVNPAGKSLMEMEDMDTSQTMIKTYIKKTGSNTSGTISFTYTKKILESAAADSTKPCVWTKNAFENDCTIYELTTVDYSDSRYQRDVELIKITAYKGLGRSDTGLYFTNGTMDIVYNNWSGSVSFGGDPSTPPAYLLTGGGNTLGGTFSRASIKAMIISSIKGSLNLK